MGLFSIPISSSKYKFRFSFLKRRTKCSISNLDWFAKKCYDFLNCMALKRKSRRKSLHTLFYCIILYLGKLNTLTNKNFTQF